MERFQIYDDTPLYYLTFTAVHWLPVFVTEESCLIITESLNYCHQHKGLRINAFVIMPTHLHLILFDKDFDVARLRRTLLDMRKYTGRQLAEFCEQKMPTAFGDVIGKPGRGDRARQFWQPSRHPVALQSEPFWRTKIDYVHDNPRRKGSVREATQWRFSSAAYWSLDPPGESDVVLTAVVW